MSPTPAVERLLRVRDELGGLLRRHGQDYFADWVDGDRAKIADGDADGASHFLQAFGGIGSLNDVVFQPRDADKELPALAEEAFQLQLGLAAD
jgi:hypothetical protein